MVSFWILATLMLGVALAFVLVPLLRARDSVAPTSAAANLEALREQRREIEADIAAGVLPPDSREEALGELAARAEVELPAGGDAPIVPARRAWPLAAGLALAVPALAIGLYLWLGDARGLDPNSVANRIAAETPPEGHPATEAPGAQGAPGTPPFNDQQILAMVETLAAKVKERPDDVKGWSLLARSMNALGRYGEAADAYEHVNKLVPNNADVLADWADALAMKQGRNLAGKPYELVKQALKIDPAHQKSLALAGTAAMNEGDYAASIRYWQGLRSQVAAGSEDQAKVDGIIEEVRGRAAATGKPLPAGPGPAPAPRVAQAPPATLPTQPAQTAPAPAPSGATVSGTVTIADALAPKVAITDTLFIFARAEGGPRVPLAVYRGGARELPKAFVLDDSMSMAPGMKLSTAQQVRIEARVSKSGNALPQPGDLVGSSAVVKPGARDVKIVIDRVVP